MDKIKITDLEVFAHHGVLPEETQDGQVFFVTVEAFCLISKAAAEDNIEKTVDYSKLAAYITDFMQSNTYKLIETAADRLAYAILSLYKYQIERVVVEIKKPNAPIKQKFGNVSVTVERFWHTAYISVGSNLGDRQGYIAHATDAFIFTDDCILTKASAVIETKPYGAVTDQPDFLNCCLEVKTLLSPERLLAKLQSIEQSAGRVRKVDKGERTLDLDLLLYDELIIDTKHLTVPHSDMHNREFVLSPLAEIAPLVRHPFLGKTIVELLEEIRK